MDDFLTFIYTLFLFIQVVILVGDMANGEYHYRKRAQIKIKNKNKNKSELGF